MSRELFRELSSAVTLPPTGEQLGIPCAGRGHNRRAAPSDGFVAISPSIMASVRPVDSAV